MKVKVYTTYGQDEYKDSYFNINGGMLEIYQTDPPRTLAYYNKDIWTICERHEDDND